MFPASTGNVALFVSLYRWLRTGSQIDDPMWIEVVCVCPMQGSACGHDDGKKMRIVGGKEQHKRSRSFKATPMQDGCGIAQVINVEACCDKPYPDG